MVQKKLSEKRASRISAINKLPKVNRELATEMLSEPDSDSDGNINKKKTKKHKLGTLMEDDRFKSMFAEQDFQVDPTSLEYKLHHPSESQTKHLSKKFERVVDEDGGSDEDMVRFSNHKKSGPKFYELKVLVWGFTFRMDSRLPKKLQRSWKKLQPNPSISIVVSNWKRKRKGMMISGLGLQEICRLPLTHQKINEEMMALYQLLDRELRKERFREGVVVEVVLEEVLVVADRPGEVLEDEEEIDLKNIFFSFDLVVFEFLQC